MKLSNAVQTIEPKGLSGLHYVSIWLQQCCISQTVSNIEFLKREKKILFLG